MNVTMRSKGVGGGGGFLSLLFLLSTFLFFVQMESALVGAASSSPSPSTSRSSYLQRRAFPLHSQSERLKKSSSSSVSASSFRRREWKTIPTKATPGTIDASNSSRNARQVPVPEIPALYSAPKIPSPEIPALYSAPEAISDAQQDAQNEVDSGVTDQQGRATTEISIGGEEEEDETSSEDIQYGVPPTEKYPGLSDDPVRENDDESRSDYPTDSPMPQATYLPPVSRNNDVPQNSYLPPKSKSNDVPQATYLPPLSRTNDVEFDDAGKRSEEDETTEDSYNSAVDDYGKGNNEPSAQYGPPQRNEVSTQYGPPRGNEPSVQYGPPQESDKKNGNGGNSRKMTPPQMRGRNGNSNDNVRRPADQQQVENSLQPTTQHQPQAYSSNSPDLQPGYLPPVYHPPQNPNQQNQQPQQREPERSSQPSQRQPQEQKPEHQVQQQQQRPPISNSYRPNIVNNEYGQQPPNTNYYTLPQAEQSHNRPEDAPTQHDDSLQDLSQDVRSPPPSLQQQQQPQGHYFGNNGNQQPQPNSFYGPPHGVNHFSHQSPLQQQQQQRPSSPNSQGGNVVDAEEELEGLNEKIVDAELLERVQQIIEDHERQQKALLDKIQKDNERNSFSSDSPSDAYPSRSNGASGISSPFSGNELSAGNNERNGDFSPFPYYGPPTSPSTNNGHSNSNPAQQQQLENTAGPGTAYLPPETSSSNNGEYTKTPVKKDPPSSTRLSADVQVQRAVLSRHFTETQPDTDSQPQSTYSSYSPTSNIGYNNNKNNNSSNPNNGQDNKSGYSQHPHQLNEVAGPGQEYLPPPSFPAQQENPRNSQNSGYSESFQPGTVTKAGGGEDHQSQPENGYSVKVRAGIRVADDVDRSTSGGSSIPYNNDANGISTRYGAVPVSASQYSGDYNARQDGGSSSQGSLDQFSAQFDAQPGSPPQHQTFPTSQVWSRTSPQQHTPASPSGPQIRYGPPSSPFNVASNNGPITTIQDGAASPFQIKNSYETSDNAVVNNLPVRGDYNQGPYSPPSPPPQYLSPIQGPAQPLTSSQPSLGPSNNNENPAEIAVPRPIYGVPLAPVITLDSDNDLHNFNNHNHQFSHSPVSHNVGPSTTNYYLTPTREDPATSPQELEATGQYNPNTADLGNFLKLHQLQQQQQQQQQPELAGGTLSNPVANYGVFPNNHINPSSAASSSSSAYLMIQGHNGNSNNHIYNINHNGYDDPSSGSSSTVLFTQTQQQPSSSSGSPNPSDIVKSDVADAHSPSSIIIPGISNTFTLPIYDYNPSHHHQQQQQQQQQQLQQLHQDDELLTSSASAPVVLPFEQFLQQHQLHPNVQTLTLPAFSSENNLRAIFYGDDDGTNRRQDNFRVSRRALSRKASITTTSANGGFSNSNNSSMTNTNNTRSNHLNQNQEQKLKHLSTPVTSTTTPKTTTTRNNRKRDNRRQRKS